MRVWKKSRVDDKSTHSIVKHPMAESKLTSMADYVREMTTLYYGMDDGKGSFIAMPIICLKEDQYAVAEFRGPIVSYSSYCTAVGAQTLEDARVMTKQKRKGIFYGIFQLSESRPTQSTRIM